MYQIKNTDIEINVDQPFANCKLGRLKYARALEKIISRNHQGGVISLNGKWGTGKTTFVRMFAQMLENKGYPTILFNAWETDFISDPLIALIGELEAVNKQSIRALEAVRDAAAKISKGIVPALAKDLITKCVGENTSNHLINTIENEVRTFKAELERYNEEKRSITEFRGCLTRYLEEITSDIVMFDEKQQGYMPLSGTVLKIRNDDFLLYNNSRYKENEKCDMLFPVRIRLSKIDNQTGNDIPMSDAFELLNQVYQFSRMYWKSVKQQNLPITIKYPEMVAEIVPHFSEAELPQFGKNNLWFL